MSENEEYLTPEEVAKRLKVSKVTIYRMARKGQIPAIKFGNAWRVSSILFQNLKNQIENK